MPLFPHFDFTSCYGHIGFLFPKDCPLGDEEILRAWFWGPKRLDFGLFSVSLSLSLTAGAAAKTIQFPPSKGMNMVWRYPARSARDVSSLPRGGRPWSVTPSATPQS